ncbi:MAG: hypothetical protein ACRC4G_02925 [Alphaproteobacteria bacterium]
MILPHQYESLEEVYLRLNYYHQHPRKTQEEHLAKQVLWKSKA